MLRKKLHISIILFLLLLSGCGNVGSENAAKQSSVAEESISRGEMAEEKGTAFDMANNVTENQREIVDTNNRMIVFEADLTIAVDGLEEKVALFQKEINKLGGYLVESSIYDIGEDRKNARIFARVPNEKFEQFLAFVETESEEVFERNVHGQDVTEEYVDLESRLKAKQVVEERLLTFMEKATKTEDLLKISTDLGQVQEEIEQIEGKMKYLEARTNFSAVTLQIQDTEILVPSLNNKDLNTWQQAKKTFIETINGLKGLTSGMVIFLIGFSPVWLIFLLIGVGGWTFYKRKKRAN